MKFESILPYNYHFLVNLRRLSLRSAAPLRLSPVAADGVHTWGIEHRIILDDLPVSIEIRVGQVQ